MKSNNTMNPATAAHATPEQYRAYLRSMQERGIIKQIPRTLTESLERRELIEDARSAAHHAIDRNIDPMHDRVSTMFKRFVDIAKDRYLTDAETRRLNLLSAANNRLSDFYYVAARVIVGKGHTPDFFRRYLDRMFDRIARIGQLVKKQQTAAIAANNAAAWKYLQEYREANTAIYSRMMNLFSEFDTSRFWRDSCSLTPVSISKTRAARLKACGRERKYQPLVNHRAPVVGRIDFSNNVYAAAVHVAAGKVNAARRRGVVDANNLYLQRWTDTVQTAAAAIWEFWREQEHAQSLIPSGYDIDTAAAEALTPYERGNTPGIFHEKAAASPLYYAARACGKWARDEEKRAQEWIDGHELQILIDKGADEGRVKREREERTAAAHLMKGNTVSDPTERAADREYIAQWTKAAAAVIGQMKTSRRNRENLLLTLQGKADKTPRPTDYRRLLDKVLTAAGLIALDTRGHRILTDPTATTITARKGEKKTRVFIRETV